MYTIQYTVHATSKLMIYDLCIVCLFSLPLSWGENDSIFLWNLISELKENKDKRTLWTVPETLKHRLQKKGYSDGIREWKWGGNRKKNTTVAKESCIKNIKRAHRENRIMFCPILSQWKYSTKTKRATTNIIPASDLRGRKIRHESNLSEALSYCG